MASWFEGTRAIWEAALARDAWMLSDAMSHVVIWPLGLAATIFGGLAVAALYRAVPVLDRKLEATVMVTSYLAIGGIIFVEVIRRFLFSQQAAWSTTIPPVLFLIMAWFACSYNVKHRTHLAFGELRGALPRGGQMACLTLDAVLWVGFCWVVVVTSARVAANSAANFQILLGTDNVMQWWFLVTVPISFVLLAGRAIENLAEDLGHLRNADPLLRTAVIGND